MTSSCYACGINIDARSSNYPFCDKCALIYTTQSKWYLPKQEAKPVAKCMIYWDVKVQAYQLQMKSDFGKIEKTVQFLKQAIPHSDRNWNPDTKTWTFTEKYLDGVQKFCVLIFGQQEVATLTRDKVEGQTRSVSVQSTNTLDLAILTFMKLLPYEAAQRAYKMAAMTLHPDRGGDMELMTKLNQAWSKIEKEVYKQ